MDDPEMRLGDDGEIEYEYDSATDDFKPKRKPRQYRTVRLPLWFILPIALLLLCGGGALLVNNYQFALCEFRVLCFSTFTYWRPDIIYSSAPPMDQSRIKGETTHYGNTGASVSIRYTDTPANYSAPACGQPEPAAKNGGTIMFTAGEGDNAELFTIKGDGSGLCRLTHNLIEERMPAWSPDGQKILFTSVRADMDYYPDIFVMDWDGTNITNLTQTANRSEYQEVWSPDGKQIAFTADPDKATDLIDIYVMNADGTGRHNITNNPASDQSPTWSPDGQRIAFMSDRDGVRNHFELYVMNADGSNVWPVKFIGTNVYSPVWSPDGQRIVFHTDDGIWMVTPYNSATQQLSRQGYWPEWSSDGKQIVFQSNYTLYVMSLEQPGSPRALTSGLKVRMIAGWH